MECRKSIRVILINLNQEGEIPPLICTKMEAPSKKTKTQVGDVRNWGGQLWVKHEDGMVYVSSKNNKIILEKSGGKREEGTQEHADFYHECIKTYDPDKEPTKVPQVKTTPPAPKVVEGKKETVIVQPPKTSVIDNNPGKEVPVRKTEIKVMSPNMGQQHLNGKTFKVLRQFEQTFPITGKTVNYYVINDENGREHHINSEFCK